MEYRGHGRRGQVPTALYSEEQVEATLRRLEIEVISDTLKDFICLCPFHGNTNSPAFSVSKTSGKFLCFNESCGEFGSLIELVKRIAHKNDFEAARIIYKAKKDSALSFTDRLQRVTAKTVMPTFQPETIERLKEAFWKTPKALDYMRGRGFEDSILEDYKIGYSEKKRVINVPMYSESGEPVGFIGRAIENKRFHNSENLPVRQTLWNLHRARRLGDTVIVCEASFDAMRIAQAGYPNVVACLGGNFNEQHAHQLMKYFKTVIIFTDWDDSREHVYDKGGKRCRKCVDAGYSACKGHNPGRDTGQKIATLVKGKQIKWATLGYKRVYDGAKDAGDMTIQQIREAIQGAVTNMEYQRWGIYYMKDLVLETPAMV